MRNIDRHIGRIFGMTSGAVGAVGMGGGCARRGELGERAGRLGSRAAWRGRAGLRGLAMLLLGALVAGLPAAVAMAGAQDAADSGPDGGLGDLPAIQADRAAFSKLDGKVTRIDDAGAGKYVRVLDEAGGETDFSIDGRTVASGVDGLIEIDAIEVGDAITAYYVKPQVITMQYPPRYTASILASFGDGSPFGVYAGLFDQDMLATDKSLQLALTDDTPIVGADGAAYGGGLANRILLAYCPILMESFPPQASPSKIVVLEGLGLPVFVNGERLHEAEARVGDGGIIMVPLRAVAEALGREVGWDGANRRATVGSLAVTPGRNEYAGEDGEPRQLEAAPVLQNDRTYVPISFFTDIVRVAFSDGEGLLEFAGEAGA
ncbi:MAG: copper amine oxidase N-terminal domain-containing protein, partial [Clostridiales bacterium]|nr:copper amine oxidase N-terminal domain-containing protein [Clostridiales bacterium]